MEARHIVRDLSFDISFASEGAALSQHNEFAHFVSGRLVAVMDEVLSAASPADGSVVKIDRLDIDLGYVAGASYYEEAERRLRHQLEEALRRRLPAFGHDGANPRNATPRNAAHHGRVSEGIITRAQSELDIVVCFLETGYLPWNTSASPGWTMEEMLRRVIRDGGSALVDRLRTADQKENLARRLARQFPGDLLMELARAFDPAGAMPMAQGGASLESANWESTNWESTLLNLISDRPSPASLIDDHPQSLAEPDPAWQGLLEKAVASGDARWIDASWARLVAGWPGLIAKVVRMLGLRAEVRRAMARRFPEPMLRDIAAILEPSEISLIEELIDRPEIFQEAAKEERESSPVLESAPVVRSHLWEFTFTYLLVERGSRFNRRMYVASVVRQMAAHDNLSYQELLASLADVLVRTETHSFLKVEMLSLLDELRLEEEAPEVVPDVGDGWEQLLEKALTTGDAEPLSRYWPDLTYNERELVERVVRRLGIHGNVRRAVAQGFPDSMLRDIAEILEPSEIGFIEKLIGRPEIFTEAAQERRESSPVLERAPAVKSRLWEFTLTYLLVERGSRFNRQTYVASVVRQMAAHDNLVYRDLLDSLADVLAQIEVRSVLKEEMLSLIVGLQRQEAAPDSSREAADSSEQDSWDRDLEQLFAAGPLHEEASAREKSVPELHAHLWASTFTCLLAERGSQFNRRSWLGSVVRQMAAHDNLVYEDLVSSLAAAANRIHTAEPLNREIHFLLADIHAAQQKTSLAEPKRLEQALATGNAELIAPLWKEWMRRDRRLVAETLKRIGVRADVRRSIANGFPESILRDIACLLAPGAAAFMQEFLQRESAEGARTKLWEFTLTFLLSEQRGAFNRKSYVVSIVRQLAVRDNLRSQDLFASMAARLKEVSTPNAEEKELLRLLLEQADEFGSPDEDRLPGVPAVIRSCELYDIVSAYMLRGERTSEGALIETIDELMRSYPWQMPRILRDCQNGLPAWLSHAELRRLATAFILLRSGGKPEMLTVFELGAGRIPHKGRYYRQIIDLLVHNLPLDFDALEAGIEAGNGAGIEAGNGAALEAGNGAEERHESAPQSSAQSPPGEMPEEVIASVFDHASHLSAAELNQLVRTLDRLLAQPPHWFLRLLRKGSKGLGAMAGILPERQLARLLHLAAAPGWHRLQLMADTIVNACLAGPFISASAQVQRLKRQFLLKYMIEARTSASEAAFVQKFLAFLAEENGYRDAKHLGTLVGRQLRLDSTATSGAARNRLLDILPAADEKPAAPLQVVRKPTAATAPKLKKPETVVNGQEIYIRNAGQVLATPYLPRLFGMAGLLEGNVFRDADSAERAMHLLQYMVDEAARPPEYLLTLNKILCGLATDAPVRRDVDLTQSEKDAVDGLLGAMIAHWKALGNTSVRGLRESFLQREGRLRAKDGNWQLLVQPRAFDMLLDRLPWGLSVIRHPWMDSTVYVEWR